MSLIRVYANLKGFLGYVFIFVFYCLVPPSIVAYSFGEEPVNTGENAGVQCMIQKGDIPITIKWTLNSRPLINGEVGITILKLSPKTSVLNIASVEQQHRGFFKCIAENKAGSSFYISELKVNGTQSSQNSPNRLDFF